MSNFLYIFLDEGGNFDFSNNGTKYFTLTSECKFRPFLLSNIIRSYKYDLIEFGLDVEYFHCSNDNKHVRNKVFSFISENISNVRIDSLIIEKSKTGPALREAKKFFPRMLGYLLKYIFKGMDTSVIEEVIVITDTIPVQKKKKAIEKAIKTTMRSIIPPECRCRVMHHSSKSATGLQIFDYCNWSIWKKWENGETEASNMIKQGIKSEFDIFQSGSKCYY